MAARSFMGSGDVLIELIVNGVGQGLEGPFYANQLSVQPNVERFESVSKGRYDRGQVLESVLVQQPADLTLELKEVQGAVLAMALLGTAEVLPLTSGTMSAQNVVTKKGKWVSLDKLRLAQNVTVVVQAQRTGTYAASGNTGNFTASSVTVANHTLPGVYTGIFQSATTYAVTSPTGAVVGSGSTGTAFSAGGLGFTITAGGTAAVAGDRFTITVAGSGSTTAVTENVDYILNRPLGLIKVLDASTLPNNALLQVSGAFSGAGGTRIRGATQNEVRCRIMFDGINQADGSEVTAEIYEAILAAESAFDFLPDEFGTVTLSGTVKTPVGKTEPFVVDLKPSA